MDVAEVKGKPILGVDVWEMHIPKYQNKRADYLKHSGMLLIGLRWLNDLKELPNKLQTKHLLPRHKDTKFEVSIVIASSLCSL